MGRRVRWWGLVLSGQFVLSAAVFGLCRISPGGYTGSTALGWERPNPNPNTVLVARIYGLPTPWLEVRHLTNEAKGIDVWQFRVLNPAFPVFGGVVALGLPVAIFARTGREGVTVTRWAWAVAGAGIGGCLTSIVMVMGTVDLPDGVWSPDYRFPALSQDPPRAELVLYEFGAVAVLVTGIGALGGGWLGWLMAGEDRAPEPPAS